MDYFSKFLRPGTQPPPKPVHDHAFEFHKSWNLIKNTLLHPDERQLTKGIKSTDVPAHLQSMVDSLVWESTRTEEGATGACLEYLLKNDVLGNLVKLSEPDRPSGIQAEVLRSVQNMVVLMDEQFLVHSAVHRAVLRLLRNCVGDDIQEQLDGRNRVRGAAGNAVRSQPSEYEEDLVNLLCILCSRIRTYRELLMIFFHDKHWYRSEPLFSVEEEDEEEENEETIIGTDNDEEETITGTDNDKPSAKSTRPSSPTPSKETVSAHASSSTKKTEYEFLLFNYLLRFVHREGQIGDFARAGLLFLMDVAMSPGEPVHRLVDDESLEQSTSTTKPERSADPITDAAIALAEYILDGDFSEVLGAGVGAVYSLLPSKLEIRPSASSDVMSGAGMVLGGSGPETEEEKQKLEATRENNRALGLEDASNPDFKSRLDHFLKLLEFLEDVLLRNVSNDSPDSSIDASTLVGNAIVQSILDAVRRIFFENVLYPSILECSDIDGSAVAVMSYIEIMIRTLRDGQLADLLVDFLVSEDNDEFTRTRIRPHSLLTLGSNASLPNKSGGTDQATKLRRRKSSAMVLLEMEAPDSRRPTEYFTAMGRFTLKDLLLSNLRSKNQPTAAAALQLLNCMLQLHCRLTVDRLILVNRDPGATIFPEPAMLSSLGHTKTDFSHDEEEEEVFVYPGTDDITLQINIPTPTIYTPVFAQPETTFSTHEREMGLYLTLVSRVDPSHNEDAFSTGYDHYLRDALCSIESHKCFQLEDSVESRAHFKHRINANDPTLSLVLESLRRFFTNTPEFNISLTGVLATLALCPDRSLAGWLTFATNDSHPDASPIDADSTDVYRDGDDRSIDFRIEERLANGSSLLPASSVDEQSRPVVHTIFHGLVAQLERYRLLVDNFDKYLLERRQGLLFSENLTDALTLALEIDNDPKGTTSPAVVSNSPALETSAQRPKPKSKGASSFVSFLTPKKNKASKPPMPSEPVTPPRTGNKTIAASPFGPHYQHTGSITLKPFIAPIPDSGVWTPAKNAKWIEDEDDVFGSGGQWGGEKRSAEWNQDSDDDDESSEQDSKTTNVTLSHLLDNVVILEESIKELVAIIHARRSLGIDSIRYL